MITCRCPGCRMVWGEDRGVDDSPISVHAFLCPRCGCMADVNKPLFNPEMPEIEKEPTEHG